MEDCAFELPTFYGARIAAGEDQEEFACPLVPVLARVGSGLRIILGTHDDNDCEKPDVLIERRPNGWAIFVHPGTDAPSAIFYILDDGRSFCIPELYAEV